MIIAINGAILKKPLSETLAPTIGKFTYSLKIISLSEVPVIVTAQYARKPIYKKYTVRAFFDTSAILFIIQSGASDLF